MFLISYKRDAIIRLPAIRNSAGKGALPTTGIPYVVINGTVVVKDSKVLKISTRASPSGGRCGIDPG
jgi:hypothetical protein